MKGFEDDKAVPSYEDQAATHLLGRKSAYMDIVLKIMNGELETISQISGHCWNEIERIDGAIE